MQEVSIRQIEQAIAENITNSTGFDLESQIDLEADYLASAVLEKIELKQPVVISDRMNSIGGRTLADKLNKAR